MSRLRNYKHEMTDEDIRRYNEELIKDVPIIFTEEMERDAILYSWTQNKKYFDGYYCFRNSIKRLKAISGKLIITPHKYRLIIKHFDDLEKARTTPSDRNKWRNLDIANENRIFNDWDRIKYNEMLEKDADISDDIDGHLASILFAGYNGAPEGEQYRYAAAVYDRKAKLSQTLYERMILTNKEYIDHIRYEKRAKKEREKVLKKAAKRVMKESEEYLHKIKKSGREITEDDIADSFYVNCTEFLEESEEKLFGKSKEDV